MYNKTILKPLLFLITSVLSTQVNAASIGTYTFEDNAIADQLLSAQGSIYDGTDWFSANGSSWLVASGTNWIDSAAPNDVTDVSGSTFLASTQSGGPVALELGFSQTSAFNDTGADLAFFFLWDQTGNSAEVSINGTTQQLIFSDVFSSADILQTADNVNWNGSVNSNVKVVAGIIDLTDFGFALGETLNSSIFIDMNSNSAGSAVALSLVAALNSAPPTPVPAPAALILFISGLASLGLFRRKKV